MRWRVIAAAVAIGVVVLAGVYALALFVLQRRILFPRPSVVGAPPRPVDAVQVWLETPSGRTEAWYLPALGAAARPAREIIYFHGNGELIDFWPTEFAEPRGWGIGVLLVEYPGYGRSGGEPSQESITQVALAAHDWMLAREPAERSTIVAHGRSLGGAAAAILASRRPVSALILESTFTSIRSFAHDFWVPEAIVRDPFESLPLVAAYAGPVLVLHGVRDTVVPLRHGEALARAAASATLVTMPCGHNDCTVPWPRIRGFLAASGVIGDGG